MPFRCLARPEPPDAIHVLVTGETGFNLNQQMAELGITPSADTICIAETFAGDSGQFWSAVPDGNYCAFARIGVAIVVMMQHFEQDQDALDAAVICPPFYQTHATNYIEFDASP